MKPFKFLYFFDSGEHYLVELKILDDSLPRERKYLWLLFDKKNQTFLKLNFRNMSQGEREFEQGKLVFDENIGTLFLREDEISMQNYSDSEPNSLFRFKCTQYLSQELVGEVP